MIRKLTAQEVRNISAALEKAGFQPLANEIRESTIQINVRRTVVGQVLDPNGEPLTFRQLRDDLIREMQWQVNGRNASDRWNNARRELAKMDDVEVFEFAKSLGHGYRLVEQTVAPKKKKPR